MIALVVLSPLIAGSAIAIRFRDGAPVLFRQTRVGRHGRPFTIYKFRTMDVRRRGSTRTSWPSQNEVNGPAFKMRDDPRVTPLGRFLRRASLDELPQLFNVLAGDMSLVGPRPALPTEVAVVRHLAPPPALGAPRHDRALAGRGPDEPSTSMTAPSSTCDTSTSGRCGRTSDPVEDRPAVFLRPGQ